MRLNRKLWTAVAALVWAGPSFAYEDPGGIINPTTAWTDTWNDVLVDLFVIGGLFAAVGAYLLWRYRATGPGQVGTAPKVNLDIALAWSLVPAALFMADDFFLAARGWSLWSIQRTVPAHSMEVNVSASQWYFEFDYGNGVKSDQLVVPVGQPIVLRMTATDVVHSFGLIEYKLKEDMLPGRITHIWFYPDKPLETFVTCVEFCGDGHSQMNAPVKAVLKADFDKWMAEQLTKKKSASLDAPRSSAAAPAASAL